MNDVNALIAKAREASNHVKDCGHRKGGKR
ncbi:hypothetical protein M2321_003942 [Rhodoblastus acidophilus]|nr:hypothetical protein [Rhodoblastus acidophilus]